MIRATLKVDNHEEVLPVFELIQEIDEINIIKLTNNMSNNLWNITLTIIFTDMIIGEIVI